MTLSVNQMGPTRNLTWSDQGIVDYKISPEWDVKLKELRETIALGALVHFRKLIGDATVEPEESKNNLLDAALTYIKPILDEFKPELGKDNVQLLSTLKSKDDLIRYFNSLKLDVKTVEKTKNEILLGLGLCSDPSQLQKLLSDISFQIRDEANKLESCITKLAEALRELERLSTDLDVALKPSLLSHYKINQIFNRAKSIPSELENHYKKELGNLAPPLSQKEDRGTTKNLLLIDSLSPKVSGALSRDARELLSPEYEKSLLDIFSNSYLFLHLLPPGDYSAALHFEKVKGLVKSLLDSQILRDFDKFKEDKDFEKFNSSQNLYRQIIGSISEHDQASFDYVFPKKDIQFVDHSLSLLKDKESKEKYRNSLIADKKGLLKALCESVEDRTDINGSSLDNLRAYLKHLLSNRKAMGSNEVDEKVTVETTLLGKKEFPISLDVDDVINIIYLKFLNREVDLLIDVLNDQINFIGNLEFKNEAEFNHSYQRISGICSILEFLSPNLLPERTISDDLKKIKNVNDRIVDLFVSNFNRISLEFVKSVDTMLPDVFLSAGWFLDSKHFNSYEPVKKILSIRDFNKDSLSFYLEPKDFNLTKSMNDLISLLKNLHKEKSKSVIGTTIERFKYNLEIAPEKSSLSFNSEPISSDNFVQVAKTRAFKELIDDFEENFRGGLKADALKKQLRDLFQNIRELKDYLKEVKFTPPYKVDLASEASLLSYFVNSVIGDVNRILKKHRESKRVVFDSKSTDYEKFVKLALACAPLYTLEPKDFDYPDRDALLIVLASPTNNDLTPYWNVWKLKKLKQLVYVGKELEKLSDIRDKRSVENVHYYANSVFAWESPLEWVNQFIPFKDNDSIDKNTIMNLFCKKEFLAGSDENAFLCLFGLIDLRIPKVSEEKTKLI